MLNEVKSGLEIKGSWIQCGDGFVIFNGEKFSPIDINLFGEICINQEPLMVEDEIFIPKKEKDSWPYKELDMIFYGKMGYSESEEGFQLLFNTDDNALMVALSDSELERFILCEHQQWCFYCL